MVGGFSALYCLSLISVASSFRLVLYAFVFLTGTLVGIGRSPLLMRILKDKVEFKELPIVGYLRYDYIGRIAGRAIFPLLAGCAFGF